MVYKPIADYGLIGNMYTAALVGNDGSIDWYCLPHFDSPSVFAAILDEGKGGYFKIAPSESSNRQQFYYPETNVLITRFLHPDGVGEITDFMPVHKENKGKGKPAHGLIRVLSCVRGSIHFRLECYPAFDYARRDHHVEIDGRGAVFRSGQEVLGLITPQTRLIILNSPANPTGGVAAAQEIERLVEGLEAHPKIYNLSDEIYSRMPYEGRSHVSLLEFGAVRDLVILLDGWSKTYAMTGWRLGYGVWPADLVEPAIRLAINCHSCVNAAAQFAGIAALEGPQDEADGMVKAFDERRRVIVGELNQTPGITCADPGGAFYAFANVTGTGMEAAALQDMWLADAGVATVAGTSFGRFGEGYVRFSYANSTANIKTAIQRIRETL